MSPSLITCRVSAPGKVILHGEHSVVYKKTAIAASLGMRTTALIKENGNCDKIICVNLKNMHVKDLIINFDDIKSGIILKMRDVAFNWSEPKKIDHHNYSNIVKSFMDGYVKNKNITENQAQAIIIILYVYCVVMYDVMDEFASFDIDVETDLNIGSGIGSSASYAVSVSGVLLQYLRLKNRQKYVERIKESHQFDLNDLQSFDAIEKMLVSELAFNCEKISHGNPSGIDNSVCTYGSLIEFRIDTEMTPHALSAGLKICLINTNVSRNTKTLVKKAATMREHHRAVIDCVLDACDNLAKEALEVIKNIGQGSIEQNDNFDKLSELFNLNHNLLRTLDVSHPSLETIYNTANEFGFGCKLTGAGGGGFAIALIPPSADEERVNNMIDALNSQGFSPQITQLGGEGVRIDL